MQKLMPVYTVISYFLLAVAAFLSLADLVGLLVSLANPSGLLGVFLLTSVIIYTFTSFYFYRQGVQKGKAVKRSLRDWIRVNAFVAIAFAVLSAIDSAFFLAKPGRIAEYYREIVKMQPAYASAGLNQASFMQMFSFLLIAFIVYAVLLLVHVTITFVVLKNNAQLFKGSTDQTA